jgi:hypothetical protein
MKTMDDPNAITVEKLTQLMKELEMAQMDREMEILLSDSGPATLILIHGGQLVEVNGQMYAVAKSLLQPDLPLSGWGWARPQRFGL